MLSLPLAMRQMYQHLCVLQVGEEKGLREGVRLSSVFVVTPVQINSEEDTLGLSVAFLASFHPRAPFLFRAVTRGGW